MGLRWGEGWGGGGMGFERNGRVNVLQKMGDDGFCSFFKLKF